MLSLQQAPSNSEFLFFNQRLKEIKNDDELCLMRTEIKYLK